MHVLVTGGAGYIGSTLVPLLLDAGYTVTVADRFYFGRDSLQAPIVQYPERLRLRQRDVRDVDLWAFEGVNAVVDLAGISNDPACELNADLTRAINYGGALRVAELAKQAGVSRLVFASSCSVYGHGKSLALSETSALNPISLYARCKADAEAQILAMASEDFTTTALRFATVFGLSARMRFDLAVNVMARCAYIDRRLRVDGGGTQWRPFVHVGDVARAIISTLEADRETVSGEVFNVGSDANNLQIRALAFRIRDAIPGTGIDMVPSDPDLRNYNVSFEKIERVLGYTTEKSIEDGVLEIRDALAHGHLDPDDRRWYTLRNYLFLGEVERTYQEVALAGRILTSGTPVPPAKGRKLNVEFYRHGLGVTEAEAVADTLGSVFLALGPRVAAFEERFAEYLGVEHVVAVNSCTMGIFLTLEAHDIGPGDEVVTTPMTFVATTNAIIHTGARPVFADVDPQTGLLTPESAGGAITERTKALVVVHLYGQMVDMRGFRALADKHGLVLIEDAAHAVESRREDYRTAEMGDATVFSFYGTKNMTCGDGGAIALHNPETATRLRRLRLHGVSRSAADDYGKLYSHWDMVEMGYKAPMTDIDASFLLPQIPKLDTRRRMREDCAAHYRQRLAGREDLVCVPHAGTSAYHLFVVLVPAAHRDRILHALNGRGIGCAVNYRAVHILSYYRNKYAFAPNDFPNALDFGNRVVSLPFWPDMPLESIDIVCDALLEILDAL